MERLGKGQERGRKRQVNNCEKLGKRLEQVRERPGKDRSKVTKVK